MCSIKSVGRKIFGTAAKKAASKAVSKVSEHGGEKAGDKIIELLHKKKKGKTESKPLTDYEINESVNQLFCSGKIVK